MLERRTKNSSMSSAQDCKAQRRYLNMRLFKGHSHRPT